jgi:hypothetical protein
LATVEQLIGAYISLRDAKAAVAKRHKDEIAPYNEKLAAIENGILKHLNKEGVNSMASANGTAFRQTRTSTKVEDWDTVISHIRDNELWHMLEKRVSKAAVDEYLEATGEGFPGVSVNSTQVINVRRS